MLPRNALNGQLHLLGAALDYAARGFAVHPLHTPRLTPKGVRCSCRRDYACPPTDVGKHPRTTGWQTRATTNPDTLREWWQRWPRANIGLVTGARSKIVVLDIDVRNGGHFTLEALEAQHGPLPDTPHAFSGGGGHHYYFASRGRLPSFDLVGINVLAAGKSVVAPPSLHASGTRYIWELSSSPEDVDLAPLPEWLAALAPASAIASGRSRDLGEEDKSTPPSPIVLQGELPHVDVETFQVSDRIKRIIREGVPKGHRSEAICGVVHAMHRAGYGAATITALLLHPEHKLSEKPLEQSHPRQWIAAEIRRISLQEKAAMATRTPHDRDEYTPEPDDTDPPEPDWNAPEPGEDRRPVIRVQPDRLRAMRLQAEKALKAYQVRRPVLFQHARRLVSITREQVFTGAPDRHATLPSLQATPVSKVRELLGQAARYQGWDSRKKGKNDTRGDWKTIDPPVDHVKAFINHGEWDVPLLTGLATRPFLRPDGTVCQTPGYDAATGIVLDGRWEPLTLPARPTRDDALAAWESLRSIWKEFTWTPRDEAMTLAFLLTLVARPAIAGAIPAFTATASTPGTGKGLLIDTCALIAYGTPAARWLASREEEEMRKQIVTIARAGESLALFDNLQHPFGGEAIDGAITSQTIAARLMTTQEEIKVPWRCVVAVTGNNLTYRGDIQRRVGQIVLQSTTENPELRTFEQPQLQAHVAAQQYRYLQDALLLLRAYDGAGRPPPARTLGGFEDWNALVRGCAEWLTDVDLFTEQVLPEDTGKAAWRAVLALWPKLFPKGETFGTAWDTISKLYRLNHDGMSEDPEHGTIAECCALYDALRNLDTRSRGDQLNRQSVTNIFGRYNNRIFNGVKMIEAFRVHNAVVWKVEKVG